MQNYQPHVQPVPESTHPRQSGPKKSNNTNLLLVILAAVLALIIVASLVVAGWALLTKPSAAKPAASPAQTTETKDKAESKAKPKTKKETKAEEDSARNADGKNPTFDFDAMSDGDYSTANGRWKAPNGDVVTIDGKIVLWEHKGKPFRAKYPKEEESKVPEEYRKVNSEQPDWKAEYITNNKNTLAKIAWLPEDPESNSITEIIFFPREFDDGVIFKYKNPNNKDDKTFGVYSTNTEHIQGVLMIKVDHPEKIHSNLDETFGMRVRCEECTGRARFYR